MKKAYLLGLVGLTLAMASCDDMLDVTPRDKFTNDPSFWNNATQVENYTNSMYGNFSGYGYSGTGGSFYFSTLTDDQVNREFENWAFTSVPQSSTSWSSPFTEIRRCNYLLEGMTSSTLADNVKAKYMAIARLSRAYNYFLLVKRYGDVQWQDHVVLSTDDEYVSGTRTDRDVVMDKVLEDLDYAIANIGNGNKVSWSKDLALAMKSEICLYEGTYCKYRTQADNGKAADANRAQTYLSECVSASQQIMGGGYSLTANYGEIYNALSLTGNSEVIFCRHYEKDVLGHSTVDYTSGSTAQSGISKDAIDAFLFTDGKPLATTGLATDDAPELIDGKYNLDKMLSVRDKRLGVLIDHTLAFKGHGNARGDLAEMTSSTAYTIAKYYTDKMGDPSATSQIYYCNNIGTGYTDAPIYWLAQIYLNFAEAKAELGNITQSDLDNSVNKLQQRAGLPGLTLNPEADPANNHGVSSLIWEIRRARRCELMTDGNRYWDLVRWHQLDKLDTSKYPSIVRGANLADVPDCEVVLENGYVVPWTAQRTFDKKYYFYPIPNNQISNSHDGTAQNPGW
ncbi:MAG: RagB/SusD family nutrient uptake outer membrane protein [Muribaculaceae bacterium]|nr:RagB/SusD family nutrient uptake outer membrane protein [Muribaculaceae bacterium]